MKTAKRSAPSTIALLPVVVALVAAAPSASFSGDNAGRPVIRDPFWPVGYAPKSKTEPTNVVDRTGIVPHEDSQQTQPPPPPEDPPKWTDLRPKGIMRMPDGRFEAVIDGVKGVVTAGQTVVKVEGKYEYTYRVDAVTATGIKYTRVGFKKVK